MDDPRLNEIACKAAKRVGRQPVANDRALTIIAAIHEAQGIRVDERNGCLAVERVYELLGEFDIPETDTLKHTLEDHERWRRDIVAMSIKEDDYDRLKKHAGKLEGELRSLREERDRYRALAESYQVAMPVERAMRKAAEAELQRLRSKNS